jgi:tyrosine-specific transport protein
MFSKLGAFIVLAVFLIPHISLPKLEEGQLKAMTGSITVAITSFGYATIIPSLRNYFHDDIKKLRMAITVGSLIPLVCYVIWDLAIMGVIPRESQHGLIAMMSSVSPTSDLVNQLSTLLQKETITTFARIFTSVCLLTSFLGVALCLADFLTDGLGLVKSWKNKLAVHIITFLPPLLIVLFYPGAFIAAISYAGICCVILLALLPALMAWFGRYHKNLGQGYRVFGGKPLLFLIIATSTLMIIQSILRL